MLLSVLILPLLVSMIKCDDYFGDHSEFNDEYNPKSYDNPPNPPNSRSYAYLAKWYPHLKRFVGRGSANGNRMYHDDSLGIAYMPGNEQDSDGPSVYNSNNDYRGDSMYGRYGSDSSEYRGSRDQEDSEKFYPNDQVSPGYRSHYQSNGYDSNPNPYTNHHNHIENPYGHSTNHKESYQSSPQFSFGHSLNHHDKKLPFDDYSYGANKFDYD